MTSKLPALLALGILAVVAGNTLQESIDVVRLQGILQEGLKSKDITSLFYAVKGLKQLNAKIPNICEAIKNAKYDPKNVEQVFQLTNAAALSNCLNILKPEVLATPIQTLEKKDATIPELYHAVYAMKAMGKGTVYDKEDALKNLIQLLKKDDSPANYGYVFQLCEHMGCAAWSAAHAEGVLLAAEESDARARHFEGGLPVTAPLLATIVRSYKSQQKPAPFSPEQRLKFASYLVSRRSVTTPRGAALLLEGAMAIADDEKTPVVITIKGKKYITAEWDSIEVSVSDVLGRPLPALGEVVAQSGTRLADDVVVLAKQPLVQKQGDATTYLLNLSKIKSQYGVYKVVVRAGAESASVTVAVLGALAWGGADVGVADADGAAPPRAHRLAHAQQWASGLAADNAQRVTIKFSVRDQSNKPVTVQQAFVHLASVADAQRETVFVAEPDTSKTYKVELNVAAIAKHVGHVSGEYRVSLLVGDSAAAAPLQWTLGDITLNFGNAPGAPAAPPARRPAKALPEIQHEFRPAEPRPPRLLSDVFALLCAAPLLLLLLLWVRLRVNLSALPLTLSAPLFHLGLGGSLGLYLVLWLRLSMFETMRYLLPLALVTFLSGHRLLRRLVSDKQR